jgi:hypothetical protein
MWPFPKKPSKADAAVGRVDAVVAIAADKWSHFCKTLPFKNDVGLAERIYSFSGPFGEGLRQNVPEFRGANDGLILLIIAKGVERSGTHSRAEIEQALGMPLPD